MSFVRRHLPAILFGAAILGMSGPWASAAHTGSWTEPFLARLGLPAGLAWAAHQALRKFGHFVAYGLFAVLALRALAGDRPPTRRLALRALVVAVLLSSVDETLQALAPDRGGSPLDVLLDGAGAATALLLLRRPTFERRRRVVAAVTPPAGDGSAR
jgi:hypothetical protein